MAGKSVWPALGPPPPHIREHGTLLLLHMSAILSKIQNKESPPVTFIETLLKDISAYLRKAQEEPMQKEILEAVQKISFNTVQHHQQVNENFTIVKAAIANQSTPQTSLLNSHNTAKPRTYVSLLQGTLSTSTSLIPQKAAINKDLEIVVRLNSAEQKAILKDVATDVILKDLNIRMRRMGRHPVRAIKGLPSGDLAILTISCCMENMCYSELSQMCYLEMHRI